MSKLLTHHIGNLRLREYAPFPRHCSDTKDMIRASRELQGITPHASGKNIGTQAHPEGFSNNHLTPLLGSAHDDARMAGHAHHEVVSNNAGESSTSGDTARVYTFNQNDCSQNANRRGK